MKNSQKGYIVPVLLGIIGLLLIGGGIYVYKNEKIKSSAGTSPVLELNQVKENDIGHIQTSNGQVPSASSVPSQSAAKIAVTGMQKYIDANFGFSFWYPSTWTVQSTTIKNNYGGGTIQKTLMITPPIAPNGWQSESITIDEFSSPTREIGIARDLCSPMSGSSVPAHRYYFDATTHAWMVEVPAHTESSERSGLEYNVPASTKLADVSLNTMGGLHMLPAGCSGAVIPLSAKNFVVFSFNSRNTGPNYITIAKTITATDPSVATPVSDNEQIQIITNAGVLLGAIGTKVGEWYVTNDHVYNSQGSIVVGANPSTFRLIVGFSDGYTAQETGFATDGVRVYSSWFSDHPVVEGADPLTFVPIHQYYQIPYAESSGRYGQSFESDDTHFAKDRSHVWYESKLIPGADPNTFVVTGDTHVQNMYGGYTLAHDAGHVYGVDTKGNVTVDGVTQQ